MTPMPPRAQHKPIPLGRYHYTLRCVCGRRIPDRERMRMPGLAFPACPNCHSTLRRFTRHRVPLITRLRAWWQLRAYNREKQNP